MRPLVCLLVMSGLLIAADDPKTAPSEQEKLQGTWVSESGELEGRKMPAEEGTTHRFTFEGDKLTIYRGDRGREATYKIDPNKKPMDVQAQRKRRRKEGHLFVGRRKTEDLCWQSGQGSAQGDVYQT